MFLTEDIDGTAGFGGKVIAGGIIRNNFDDNCALVGADVDVGVSIWNIVDDVIEIVTIVFATFDFDVNFVESWLIVV